MSLYRLRGASRAARSLGSRPVKQAETRTAPRSGRRRCHVKSELPSVHLLRRDRPFDLPASARLPRLVARGYTGFAVTGRYSPYFFLRRIRRLVNP